MTVAGKWRPWILLVGSGYSADYREWVLKSISAKYRVWLLDHRVMDWVEPYISGTTTEDVLNFDQALGAVRNSVGALPISGVVCYDEMRIWHAARLAEALGLPTNPPESVLACRDKNATREALAAAGVPQARSSRARGFDAVAEAARCIGYPVVLKPRALAASEGVVLVKNAEELPSSFEFTSAATPDEAADYDYGDILVEEYLDGPEIAADCVVDDGTVFPVFVSHKEQEQPPTFEETGHIIDPVDPLLRDTELLTIMQSAHTALGLTHGVTHSEVRFTSAGPKVIEVNARLGGELIPYVGLLATGIDLALAMADLATGATPRLTPTRRLAAGVRFLYPSYDLVVDAVSVRTDRLPSGIWETKSLAEQGETLLLPPKSFVLGRAAMGVALGHDRAACVAALNELPQAVEISGKRI